MTDQDPAQALAAALREQHARRREVLRAGARHVGWKLGIGDRERLGASIAVGYLTSASCADDGAIVAADPDAALHADVELAVELRRTIDPRDGVGAARAAIGGYRTALEIVDLAPVLDSAVAVIATNVFHRAVAFGPAHQMLPAGDLAGTARVDGEVRGSAPAPRDVAERLHAAAQALATVGGRLEAGDLIITGSVVQVPVRVGGDVRAELTGLGAVRLSIRG